jgi:hypothetical protein
VILFATRGALAHRDRGLSTINDANRPRGAQPQTSSSWTVSSRLVSVAKPRPDQPVVASLPGPGGDFRWPAGHRLRPLVRRPGAFVVLGLLGLALGIYLPFAVRAGWYYDDWALFGAMHGGGASWGQRFDACVQAASDGRKLECVFPTTEYQLLGSHRFAYALFSIGLLVLMAGLAYAILRRCRLAWPWAAAAAALLIVFPGSDSSRLWPVGSNAEYAVSLVLIGTFIVLMALRRDTRWPQLLMHAFAALLSVVALLTYEIVLPLVAVNGLIYWAAYRNRRALWRGAIDLGIAGAFVIYRLAIAPVDAASGFVVHRTLGADISRGWTLLKTAWSTWQQVFAPGWGGLAAIAIVLLAGAVYSIRTPELRSRFLPWFALLAASVVVAGVSALSFVTANDLYLLDLDGTFNRLNLPGSFAYACAFVALLGIVYELARRLVSWRGFALVAVGALVAVSTWHQLVISAEHKRAWEVSWSEQKTALAGYRIAVQGLPTNARVVGMGAPIYEDGFVPVFAASWDLQGAIAYTTPVKPPAAMPLDPTLQCGASGLVSGGALQMPYRLPGQPLYFINAQRRAAISVDSQAGCEHAIALWGRPPFWGRTVPS